jgi:hypothetical protein
MVKNKAYVETLIYKAYIIKEISIFTLYYFELRILRHDDNGGLLCSENLSIFYILEDHY